MLSRIKECTSAPHSIYCSFNLLAKYAAYITLENSHDNIRGR